MSIQDIDLTIFSSIDGHSPEHIKCVNIKRLLTGLSYYANLDIIQNTKHQSLFTKFMNEIYTNQICDDFHHLTKHHQHQMELIQRIAVESYHLSSCDLSTCSYSDRHYRIKQETEYESNITNNDHHLSIYKDIMDSLHYYVYHLTEAGFRNTFNISANNLERKHNPRQSSYGFDSVFSRMVSSVHRSRAKTNRFTRIHGNKFNICVVDQESTTIQNAGTITDGDPTFLDSVYSELFAIYDTDANGEMLQLVFRLQKVIESNGYDTDSLDLDLEIYKEQEETCNILTALSDKSSDQNQRSIARKIMQRIYAGASQESFIKECRWIIGKMCEIFETAKSYFSLHTPN